jgi:CRISPR-associated protein Csm3
MTQANVPDTFQLRGRVIITGSIRAITGLRVGSSDKAIGIGDAAQVLRDPLTNRPYIPGSSLRGKLRSLAERARWASLSTQGNLQPVGNAAVHRCNKGAGKAQYEGCPICPVFGVTSDHPHATPTRLLVRDLLLSDESADELSRARTDFPFTEVKTEVAIDRITAASNPREIERVPAGAVFSGLDLSFAIYQDRDVTQRFAVLPHAMALLEDDYLGGHGARGYGRVRFEDLTLTVRRYAGMTVHDTNLVEGGLVADLEQAKLPDKIMQAVAVKD